LNSLTRMFPTSLRWRLPVSYAGLALLTAVLLNVLLLVTLQLYYQGLEQRYLLGSGMSGSAELAGLLAAGDEARTLEARARELARQYDVRLWLADASGLEVVDTGPPVPLPLGSMAVTEATPAPGATAAAPFVFDAGAFLEAAYGFDRLRRTGEAAEITLVEPGSGRPLGRLRVSEGPAYGQDIVASVGRVGAAAGLAAVVLAAGAGWLVSRRMVAPLVALTETSTRMAQGHLGARSAIARADEIGALAASFNSMAGQVEGTVDTLRAFIADAAHELHTPHAADRAGDRPGPGLIRNRPGQGAGLCGAGTGANRAAGRAEQRPAGPLAAGGEHQAGANRRGPGAVST
jgi:methyl-accepting chemotaxis protein